jgi:anaerobic magnesium-protoporphyrin IX monomethyl ester cyclase
MKKAGCIRLRFGVESGNAEILKLMNKRITKEQVIAAITNCKKVGIEAFAYFIIAYPTETAKTMQETIDFAVKISPDYVMFNVAVPYPMTNLYELAIKEGIVTGDYWADFTLGKKVKKIPPFIKDANKWVRKAYLRFYLRPGFLFREILKIRSYSDLVKHINAFIGILEL